MPMPESQFTFAWYVKQELSELGCSAMLSGQHAIFGRSKVELVVDVGWIIGSGG